MRLLFVNHLHPASGLIGSVRLHRFAQELARRGHQVVLLCGGWEGVSCDTPESLEARFSCHDWWEPMVLAVGDDPMSDPRAGGAGRRTLSSRFGTFYNLHVRGGSFWRWRKDAAGFLGMIGRLLRPELAYASFGNLDALGIAQQLARDEGIPWVLDIKDSTSVFLPRETRSWIMRRFRDAAAVTLNAEFQRSRNPGWADARSVVIHSGVESVGDPTSGHDPDRIALVGSLYSGEPVSVLLDGFKMWRADSTERKLHYFGRDEAWLAEMASRVSVSDGVVFEGYVPRFEMLRRCSKMGVLAYVGHLDTFHHKLPELAVLGRPLLCVPSDSDEERWLAARFDFPLVEAGSPDQVRDALDCLTRRPSQKMNKMIREMSWVSAAGKLEAVFEGVVGQRS